jgi:alkanesulfonate monooxygenase SsuD/methylene tetrahydromethanopterin reductase-like flavin-dependent oxidoreductase (luciferase family)/putative sterol carrier protein
VRFGIFYEHQLPRPWEEGAEQRLYADALEQVELADRVGFDYVWEVEHHFLEEYSHSSAPEVFLAAASQRTRRIRLGHGIVQIPPPFNHPARVAERIAALDLVSGGRVEFGTGESSSQAELGGFGVDRELKRAQWDEALDAITRMFVEEPFAGYDGAFLKMPPRNVVPKPVQKPHPPLWVACSRRETILTAARKGLGALSFSFIEPERAKEWADEYYRLVASDECVPAGFSVNANVAVVLPFMCHEDEDTAIERGIDGGHFFGYSLSHYYVFGEHRPGRTVIWDEFEANRRDMGFARELITPESQPLGVSLLQEGLGSLRGAIGTPAQIEDLIDRYEAAGVDQVIFVSQAGRNRHEDICESLELFAKSVMPKYAERADDVDDARRERLAEATEAALARREPARRFDRDYVISAQGEPDPAPASPPADGSVAALRADLGPRPRRPMTQRITREISKGRARLQQQTQERFISYLKGKPDEQLDRMLGSPPVLRAVFAGMARTFRPDRAQGFQGGIQYELTGSRGVARWGIKVAGSTASAVRGPVHDPAVTLTMSIPTFAKIVTGDVDGAKAFFEGRIKVQGDLSVAARLGEMFGNRSTF